MLTRWEKSVTDVELTTKSLLAPSMGVLVLDEYAENIVNGQGLWPTSFERFVSLVLSSSAIRPYVSGVLLAPRAFAASQTVRESIQLRDRVLIGVRCTPPQRLDDRLFEGLGRLRRGGARFAEWRANLPALEVGRGEVHVDCAALARGALASQLEELLPVLTVAMPDLGSHTLAVTQAATSNALIALFGELRQAGVNVNHMVLRVNMVVPGDHAPRAADPEQVAEATLRLLSTAVPAEVPGVIFLSGGQPLDRVCANLAAITCLAHTQDAPWRLSFGFTRAIVSSSIAGWDGTSGSPLAQLKLAESCQAASQAVSPLTTV